MNWKKQGFGPSGSGYNKMRGSRSGIRVRIRIQQGKNNPKKEKRRELEEISSFEVLVVSLESWRLLPKLENSSLRP
jgi:hypothetical protein